MAAPSLLCFPDGVATEGHPYSCYEVRQKTLTLSGFRVSFKAMLPFSNPGPVNHSEKKALFYAALFSVLFIVLLGVSAPVKRTTKYAATTVAGPVPPTKPAEPSQPTFAEPLDEFRVVPKIFSNVDFRNFSYGTYMTSEGKPINLTLTQSVKPLNDTGWFELKDVYYKDLTGDRQAEAIVRLSHVECEVSCDGGSNIFYVYTMRGGKLKKIWGYETGSYAYGCGLKSFTMGNKQMVMELFGECARQATESPGPSKFVVEHLTFILFEFDGNRFLTKTIEFIPEPARNVKNYRPEIRIY